MDDFDRLIAHCLGQPVDDPARVSAILADLGVESLDEVQMSAFVEMVTDLAKGDSSRVNQIITIDYIEPPVTPDQFLDDPYYFGHVGEGLWPAWRPILRDVMDPGAGITELILTGAIGIGKTSAALIVIAYRIYLISLLKDPHRFFRQLKLSRFYFGLFNVWKHKAEEMYLKLKAAINSSPYFMEKFPTNPRKTDTLEFPRHVVVVQGASELATLGENLVSCHLSEVNFMRSGRQNELGQAWKIYNNVGKRIRSRFMFQGFTPGVVILDSSRRATSDMLEEHLAQVEGDVNTKVVAGALWDFKPESEFTGKRFRLALGDALRSSRVLEEDEQAPMDVEVIDVPEEYRREFEKDPDGSTRDIAGRATFAVRPFITDRESLVRCVDPKQVHPFTHEFAVLSTGDDNELIDWLIRERLVTIKRGQYQPLLNPGRLRYMHWDLSKSQCSTGTAMGHIEKMEWTKPYAADIDAPILTVETRIDLMMRINPPGLPDEIDFVKIRRFIAALSEMGFMFGLITFDGYNSIDMIQTLRRAGYRAEELSLDRSERPYIVLKNALSEGRLRCYHYPPFIQEASALERNDVKRKIDHPKNGSKDVSDAVAAVVWSTLLHGPADGDVKDMPTYTRDEGVEMRDSTGRVVPGVRMRGDQLIGRDYKG